MNRLNLGLDVRDKGIRDLTGDTCIACFKDLGSHTAKNAGSLWELRANKETGTSVL